ncbi:MAG: virulence RhuM family protein [Muribaculaceae bacterium]|nr:virulence RhuM family protein [Muribaculaceae bacterium]
MLWSTFKCYSDVLFLDLLKPDSTCALFAQVQTEGKRQVERQIPIYNLDMIISVGYRVNSHPQTML